MHSSPQRTVRRYANRDAEEDRAWAQLYRRTADPAVAAEVVHQLDTDAEARRWHLALYLRCRHTLSRRKARQQRRKRIGRFVRAIFALLVTRPAAALHGFFSRDERFDGASPKRAAPNVRAAHELRPLLIESLARTAPSTSIGGIDQTAAADVEKAA